MAKDQIVRQALEEWQAELKERAGDPPDPTRLAFVCPNCGNVATAKDFLDAGEVADRAATNCIGRFVSGKGCDWAAYGLFGVLTKGRILTKPDGGTVQVFEFAEAP